MHLCYLQSRFLARSRVVVRWRGSLVVNERGRGQMNRPNQTPISVTDRFTNLGRFFWILGLVIAIAAFCQLPAFAQFASGSIGATVADTTAVFGQVHTARPSRSTADSGWECVWCGHCGQFVGRPMLQSSSTAHSWN